MEKSKSKEAQLLEETEDSLEFCKDIYKYYEKKKENVEYFDINKNSILYSMSEPKMIEVPERVREKVVVEKVSFFSQVLFFAVSILAAVLLSRLISGVLIQDTVVKGHSMNPTLENREKLILDKFSYVRGRPKRFDIVVFSFNNGEHFVKRVIGLPGEKVQIIDGRVYINDALLEDDPISEYIQYAGIAKEGIIVEKDRYFVLGDNRNNSYDSRSEDIGAINRKVILGKVWFRFYPIFKLGMVK